MGSGNKLRDDDTKNWEKQQPKKIVKIGEALHSLDFLTKLKNLQGDTSLVLCRPPTYELKFLIGY